MWWLIVIALIILIIFFEYNENDCLIHKTCSAVPNDPPDNEIDLIKYIKVQVHKTNSVKFWRQSVLAGLIGAGLLTLLVLDEFDIVNFMIMFILITVLVFMSFSWITYHYYLQNNIKIQQNLDKLIV